LNVTLEQSRVDRDGGLRFRRNRHTPVISENVLNGTHRAN